MPRNWANATAEATETTETTETTAATDTGAETNGPLARVTEADADELEKRADVTVHRNFLREAVNGNLSDSHRDRARAQAAFIRGDDPFAVFKDTKDDIHAVNLWKPDRGGHGRNILNTRGRLIAGFEPVPSDGVEKLPDDIDPVSDPTE